jgi:hypothetical protein
VSLSPHIFIRKIVEVPLPVEVSVITKLVYDPEVFSCGKLPGVGNAISMTLSGMDVGFFVKVKYISQHITTYDFTGTP